MKKVKLFGPDKGPTVQQDIDGWIREEQPSIISVDTAICGGNGYGVYTSITILYTENINKQ